MSTATPPAYNAPAAPQAMRLLLEAAPSVPASGKSGIEYDLVMLGFEWMQTLFEDYWTLAKSACAPGGGGGGKRPGVNTTACEPCKSPLPTSQQFAWDGGGSGGTIELLDSKGDPSGMCLDGSCTKQCDSIGLGDCKELGDAAVFKSGQGGGSKEILSQHGLALDYGVYCTSCKPSLGLATPNPAFTWENMDVNLSSVGTPSISLVPQTGGRCCLTAIGVAPGSCAAAIHAACPGKQGNDCITCVEKHAAALSVDCDDLNSQMHGVCGALAASESEQQTPLGHAATRQQTQKQHEAACNATTAAVRGLIDDLDRFVGSHPLWLLGNWTVSSRIGAADAADADNLEYGARNLITRTSDCIAADAYMHTTRATLSLCCTITGSNRRSLYLPLDVPLALPLLTCPLLGLPVLASVSGSAAHVCPCLCCGHV
jgi:hypothetical protein